MDIIKHISRIARLKDQIQSIRDLLDEDDTLRPCVKDNYEAHLESMEKEYYELTQEFFEFNN